MELQVTITTKRWYILYYLWEDPLQDRLLFIVQKGLRQQILRYCHDLRSSGHMGQDKTINQLKKKCILVWHVYRLQIICVNL
jgi:hypothetical protein